MADRAVQILSAGRRNAINAESAVRAGHKRSFKGGPPATAVGRRKSPLVNSIPLYFAVYKAVDQLPVAMRDPFPGHGVHFLASRKSDRFGGLEHSTEEFDPFHVRSIFQLESKHCFQHKPDRRGLCRAFSQMQIEGSSFVHQRCTTFSAAAGANWHSGWRSISWHVRHTTVKNDSLWKSCSMGELFRATSSLAVPTVSPPCKS